MAPARKLLVLYSYSFADQTRNKDDTNKSRFTVVDWTTLGCPRRSFTEIAECLVGVSRRQPSVGWT